MHAGLHASSACCPATYCASAADEARVRVAPKSYPAEYGAGAFHSLRELNERAARARAKHQQRAQRTTRTRTEFARAERDRSPFPSAGSVRGRRRSLCGEERLLKYSRRNRTQCRRMRHAVGDSRATESAHAAHAKKSPAARQSLAPRRAETYQLGGSVKLGSASPPRFSKLLPVAACAEVTDCAKLRFLGFSRRFCVFTRPSC